MYNWPTRSSLLLMTLLWASLGASEAAAVTSYLNSFNDEFGTAGTRLDTCGLCHGNFSNNSDGRNSYGAAFGRLSTHESDPVAAFLALQNSDADQDGATSANEIAALFMPGWSCGDFGDASSAPTDLADYVDPANPGCALEPELDCFDGIDNDADGLVDCADSDCDDVSNGSCLTAQPGVCSAGALTCQAGAELCIADFLPGQEGPAGDATCSDALDNDCDASTDALDPGCQLAQEANCTNGIDDDGDGNADCADSDCAGALLGSCDTGEPGVCTPGSLSCSGGEAICLADSPAEIEGPADAPSCSDSLDNDCDGLADSNDPDCLVTDTADVYAIGLRAPKRLRLRVGSSASRQIVVSADGDLRPQQATVELGVAPLEALSISIDPGSITRMIEPGGGASHFRFRATLLCTAPGSWIVEWSAAIEAGENREALDDLLMANTRVVCR